MIWLFEQEEASDEMLALGLFRGLERRCTATGKAVLGIFGPLHGDFIQARLGQFRSARQDSVGRIGAASPLTAPVISEGPETYTLEYGGRQDPRRRSITLCNMMDMTARELVQAKVSSQGEKDDSYIFMMEGRQGSSALPSVPRSAPCCISGLGRFRCPAEPPRW